MHLLGSIFMYVFFDGRGDVFVWQKMSTSYLKLGTKERARAPTGEKVHKSNRILHALLKKTCKTGGGVF